MEWPEKFFEIIYQIVIQQNRNLLREIAIREKIPLQDMYKKYLTLPRKEFKMFMETYSSTSSSSSG